MGTARVSDIAASLAPVARWPNHEHSGHAVQFYTEDASLIDGLSRFIGPALASGDAAIVIATKAHRDALDQRLKERGFDPGNVIAGERYIVLDAAETLTTFMVDGWPDAKQFANVIGEVILRATAAAEGSRPRVAAFGEMVALLWAEGKSEAAIRLEELWNDLAHTHSFYLQCAYPMKGFDREEHSEPFLKICAEHSGVIPGESYTALATDEERLRSISHLQQKAQALETETAERKEIQKSLRRRESELADILENAVEGVQQVGPDQKILWANNALLNLLGYAPEEYVNHNLSEFHLQPEVFDDFWGKLMKRQDIYDFPAEFKCKDGSVKHVLIHSNGLWDGEKFVHTRCFVRDVTEYHQMEQALRESERHAAMGRLAAIIAHEINNPLEAVMNVFYLLRNHPSLDEQARELASIAEEELNRVGHITKQTLAFYRESAKPVPVSLSKILDEVLEVYTRLLRLHGISVEKQSATEGAITAFPVEMRQVFVNLIGNAVQAMPAGGKLRISLRRCSQWAQHSRRSGVLVNITDTGVGVPAHYRDKIFQPFVTTKAEKGTGLGLWVSRGIIQKLDGTIRFRTAKVQGKAVTSFAVFIPTNDGEQQAAPPTVSLRAEHARFSGETAAD